MSVQNQILESHTFFPVWRLNFEGQLRKLYHELKVEDEGVMVNFMGMPFNDFCLLIYTDRSDLIDYSQN